MCVCGSFFVKCLRVCVFACLRDCLCLCLLYNILLGRSVFQNMNKCVCFLERIHAFILHTCFVLCLTKVIILVIIIIAAQIQY